MFLERFKLYSNIYMKNKKLISVLFEKRFFIKFYLKNTLLLRKDFLTLNVGLRETKSNKQIVY
jgi:hypothetical protein